MHKNITQIRDLSLIENELNNNVAGVLAFMHGSDKIEQIATPFLYQDKNIYIYFSNEDEYFENIHFHDDVSFTIIKIGKAKKIKELSFDPTYNFFSISVKGSIRNIDDIKLIEDLRLNYLKKYKKIVEGEIDFSALSKIIIIDSKEIQAFEETGG
jgi:nitroimidazol reductase NimA-like FMN-containing flavoprotein (pyridoxamine 5'-phosphate oxidase superfamily)